MVSWLPDQSIYLWKQLIGQSFADTLYVSILSSESYRKEPELRELLFGVQAVFLNLSKKTFSDKIVAMPYSYMYSNRMASH